MPGHRGVHRGGAGQLGERLADLDPGVADIVQAIVMILVQTALQELAHLERCGGGEGVPLRLALENPRQRVGGFE